MTRGEVLYRLSISTASFDVIVKAKPFDFAQGKEDDVRKLIVSEFVTLDGVMQAPGGKDEDRDGGFEHGGWTMPYWHDDIGATFFDADAGRATRSCSAAAPTSRTPRRSSRCRRAIRSAT